MADTEVPTPSAASEGGAASAARVTPLSVLEALARLLAAASVYPADHPRIAAIVAPVLEAVRGGASGRLFVKVPEPNSQRGATPATKRLLRDLHALGIARLRIDKGVSIADLCSFAKFLRQHSGSAGGFRHVDAGFLPWTIQVEERSFGEPTFRDDEQAPAPVDPAEEELRTSRVAPVEVDEETMETVRKAVRAALRGERAAFRRAVAPKHAASDEEEPVRASAEAVREWLERHDPAKVQARAPGEILADAERTLPEVLPGIDWTPVLDTIRNAVDEHMRSVFRGEGRADFVAGTPTREEAAKRAESKADLVRQVFEFAREAEPFDSLPAADRAEQLSILLHILHRTSTKGETEGVVRRLGACLSARPGPREKSVLVGWLRDAAGACAVKDLDARLVPVFGALRLSGGGDVADVVLETCAGEQARLAPALWPHAAYEMFTGHDAGTTARREGLKALVLSVPAERVRGETARLGALIALLPRPAAHDAVSPPLPAFHALYEVLLDAPRETGLGAAVATAFKQYPPRHPAAGALVALPAGDERAQRLVARIIRDGETRSPGLRMLAVDILVGALRDLPRGRRGDTWVVAALRALGDLACAESVKMLREVRSARSFWVRWKWPPAARSAAAAALSGVDEDVLPASGEGTP
jgi:hypothetical protein